MSAQTISLIRRYYEAFNAGDMTLFLSLVSDDVAHDINQSGREVGKNTFARFMERMNRSYKEEIVDIVIFSTSDGTRAASEFTVLGTYLKTDEGLPEAVGQKYRLPGGAFFDVSDGKITRVTNYYNLQEWLRQVGS